MIHRNTCVLAAAVQLFFCLAFGQVLGKGDINTFHMHHLPPLLFLRPCGQRSRTDNSRCIDHQGRVSIALSLLQPLPRPLSVCHFPFMAVFLPSPENFSVNKRKHKLNIKTPHSPLNTCHLSFVQIMARVAIETALFSFLFFANFCFIKFAGETERKRGREKGKQTARENTTVNYEYGGMIKNEPFKNPICHGGVR